MIDLNIIDRHYVYAMLCQDQGGPGYIKFGRSRKIGGRLSQLRTSCPIPARYFAVLEVGTLPVAKKIERALHQQFKSRKTHGGWFGFDFSSEQDKWDFNDGCRIVFASGYGNHDDWWTKISVAALDAYDRERRRKFIQSRKGKRLAKRARDNRIANRELRNYGT